MPVSIVTVSGYGVGFSARAGAAMVRQATIRPAARIRMTDLLALAAVLATAAAPGKTTGRESQVIGCRLNGSFD
ncbi:hypothetical protein GCM10017083_27050 [Thalassobaculum fulvum]|uniref:Uncharacterized protein n=1 Tax=Thalassobaculum fulvum TaxID=1633335 RepID=A0A919CQD6_9PROT|nr:hypothetical protein GCM10017083_27050 [Thalassobaculum fulvum]